MWGGEVDSVPYRRRVRSRVTHGTPGSGRTEETHPPAPVGVPTRESHYKTETPLKSLQGRSVPAPSSYKTYADGPTSLLRLGVRRTVGPGEPSPI